MCLASIHRAAKWQGCGGLGVCLRCSSSQDARAFCWRAGEDDLALGGEDAVAVGAQWPSTSHLTIPHGCGRDLTFRSALQVSEHVRICTNSHDMYMTRSGCWLIDERIGTGDVGEDKPRKKLGLLSFLFTGKDFCNPLKCCHRTS